MMTNQSLLSTLAAVSALLLALTGFACYIYYEMHRRLKTARQQVQFVGQVSHELKTPLTNINFYTEMLKEIETDHSDTNRYLNVISEESGRLTRLIQNVLNFTKSPTPNIQPIQIHGLVTHLHETFAPVFSNKGIQVNNIISSNIETHTTIYSDSDMLMQILGNFMSNAEKYAADGKQVDIEANLEKGKLVLSVRDYGKGMSKHNMKKVFKPFYRVNNHITEGVAGTGIGLTIAKQLAQALRAKITIVNSQPGLRFCLSLPVDTPSENQS